jgi:hypothetical protein
MVFSGRRETAAGDSVSGQIWGEHSRSEGPGTEQMRKMSRNYAYRDDSGEYSRVRLRDIGVG